MQPLRDRTPPDPHAADILGRSRHRAQARDSGGRISFAAMPLPEDLVAKLAAAHGIRRAVETGTWTGDGTRALARRFDKVETIELSLKLALRAKRAFLFEPRVRVRYGDSAKLLRPSTEPTLYWLDGHWSGGETAGADHECPVLDEIRATSPGHRQDCYLIDDARLFVEPPPPPHDPAQWPTLDEIRELLAQVRPQHAVQVVGDVIVAEPIAARVTPEIG
jgi:hypothetical protein